MTFIPIRTADGRIENTVPEQNEYEKHVEGGMDGFFRTKLRPRMGTSGVKPGQLEDKGFQPGPAKN